MVKIHNYRKSYGSVDILDIKHYITLDYVLQKKYKPELCSSFSTA